MTQPGTLLLSRSDVERLLAPDECFGAVEDAFRQHALGKTPGPGILGLHAMATEIAIENIRKRALKETATLTRVYQNTLSFCEKKLKGDDPAFPRSQVLGLLLNTMNSSQAILANHQPREWDSGIQLIRPILREDFVQAHARELPAVVQCFVGDFEACTAHLRFPLRCLRQAAGAQADVRGGDSRSRSLARLDDRRVRAASTEGDP